MYFQKDDLLKVAKEIIKDGVTVSGVDGLYKKASAIRIAYLTAFIKKNY